MPETVRGGGSGVLGRLLGARAPSRFAWPVHLSLEAGRWGLVRGAAMVVLRPLRVEDEPRWSALRLADDARLRPWEATVPPGGGEELAGFRRYVRTQDRRARRGEAMILAVEVDGVLAGQLCVDPIQWGSLRSAQVGYWVGADHEGRGVMRLAVAMILDHLLGPGVGLHRVEINVRPENERSLRLCRSLGLRQEGVRHHYMHINGAWADHVSFAVVAEERSGERSGGGAFVQELIRQQR